MNKLITVLIFAASLMLHSQEFSPENLIPKPKLGYAKSNDDYFSINHLTGIVINDNKLINTTAFLNNKLEKLYIQKLPVFQNELPDSLAFGIYLGICDDKLNKILENSSDQPISVSKDFPGAEGYVLDVQQSRIIINASDERGLTNGILTLIQTFIPGDVTTFVPSYRIADYPDYPVRWIYYPTNFLVGQNTTTLKNRWEEWSKWKISGINVNDVKFEFITTQPKRYYDSLGSAVKFAKELNLDLIPGVMPWGYSNSLMFFDPNFATGLPVKSQKFVVESDTAKIIPTVDVTMSNGDFENSNSNKFPGFLFIDGEGTKSFADKSIFKTGNTSIRFENFDGSNARVCYRTKASPFKNYHISGWIRTENANPAGDIRLTVLNNKGQTLNYANLNIPTTTNGWKKIDVMVNSLLGDTITVYWGMWGAKSGKLWWDGLKVEEEPFVNLLRREGTPLMVDNPLYDYIIREGIDFDTLVDKKLGTAAGWFGEFDTYHQPPTFKIKKDGNIKNGDTVYMTYYHAITIYDGQVMVTMSDENLYKQIEREFRIVDSIIKPKTYFMNHDEIRVMNWDMGDETRQMTPRELLADNVRQSIDIIHKYNPQADVWNWSDMFDNFHNARNNYYLVNGDLTDVADLIPNTMGIVNWNSQQNVNAKSTAFFADKGFRQISAPFYDTDQNNIRIWKERSKDVENFIGMLYTTWSGNYDYVRHFAEYSWNHAPHIIHTPLFGIIPQGNIKMKFKILGDDMDNSWDLKTAALYYRTDKTSDFDKITISDYGKIDSITLSLPNNNNYLEYYIEAEDNHGWQKRIPLKEDTYYTLGSPSSINDDIKINFITLKISNGNLEFSGMDFTGIEIELLDILGRTVNYSPLRIKGSDIFQIDISSLKAGIYFAKMKSINKTVIKKFIKE